MNEFYGRKKIARHFIKEECFHLVAIFSIIITKHVTNNEKQTPISNSLVI